MNKKQNQARILEAIEMIENGSYDFACHALGSSGPLVEEFSNLFQDPLQGSDWTFFLFQEVLSSPRILQTTSVKTSVSLPSGYSTTCNNMSTTTQRPTPECDANSFVARKVVNDEYYGLHDVIPLKLSEMLERERDEAREQLEASKIKLEFLAAKGITVGILKSSDCPQGQLAYNIQSGSELCDLKHIDKVIDAESKLEAMREAIKEAVMTIENGVLNPMAHPAEKPANLKAALAKLQPFLKP